MKLADQSYYHWRKKETLAFPGLRARIVESTIKEILSLVKDKIDKPINSLVILDVGCGNGEYSFEIEKHVRKVVGAEPYKPAYKEAIETKKRVGSEVKFYNQLIENFVTRDKFDLVLSLTTIEHMPNAERSYEKVFSLIRKGGLLYLTAPNKLWPWEPHYRLPFLYWLPLSIANLYVRISKKGKSYEDCAYAKTYLGMRKFLDKFPCEYEFIVPKDSMAVHIGHARGGGFYKILKSVGVWFIKKHAFFWNFSKGFIVLAKKT